MTIGGITGLGNRIANYSVGMAKEDPSLRFGMPSECWRRYFAKMAIVISQRRLGIPKRSEGSSLNGSTHPVEN